MQQDDDVEYATHRSSLFTSNMAAEAKVPFDAALDSVLSSLERKFTLKEEQLLELKHNGNSR